MVQRSTSLSGAKTLSNLRHNVEGEGVQGLAKVGALVLVNFITPVAYHFCPSLPAAAAFTQPEDHLLAELCRLGAVANQRKNAVSNSDRQNNGRHYLFMQPLRAGGNTRDFFRSTFKSRRNPSCVIYSRQKGKRGSETRE